MRAELVLEEREAAEARADACAVVGVGVAEAQAEVDGAVTGGRLDEDLAAPDRVLANEDLGLAAAARA